jgi:lipid-A-disaccharide synthase
VPTPALLFTAFEPSGDDHASAVIAELRRRYPALPIYAWGGPKMEKAGATIIEHTGDDAVMGMPGLKKIQEHKRINRRIQAWLNNPPHPIAVHIPVDSPAANFPICRIAKRVGAHSGRGIKVVHLVAPQIWAWGRWRIHKLRRLTDLVLCLLPFEQRFFTRRGVPARFVGHPLFDTPIDGPDLDRRAQEAGFPTGSPRIALMPGSRPAELEKSFPLLLQAYRLIRAQFPDLVGVVAATKPEVARHLRNVADRLGGLPPGMMIAAGETDAVIRWSQLALVKSGTITLQIAKQQRPMVIFYKSSPITYYLVGKWVVATKFFTLPNLIAGRRIVPELVPYFGGPGPVAAEALALLSSPDKMDQQRNQLTRVCESFAGITAAHAAADAIAEVAGLPPTTAGASDESGIAGRISAG